MSYFFKSISLLATILIFSSILYAQNQRTEVSGFVSDSDTSDPIPYATVLAKQNQNLLNGTTSDENGSFNFEVSGTDFSIEISFIGYESTIIDDFTITNGKVQLGAVTLNSSSHTLTEVEVSAERSTSEFKLDKRVFNVGQDISSSGMGALDVLNNVPSVSVDIEGQIRLRGNTGVQILLNGKPSVLTDEGTNALSTITADMIERVEVITNPSAKYEAEGTSGIINIVLKKEEEKGLNGSISVNTGSPDNHSVGISLNRRTNHFNIFTQMGAGYRSLPRHFESTNQDIISGTSILSNGTNYRNEEFYNITLGTDYHIDEYNVITLAGNFAYEIEDQPSETSYRLLNGNEEIISEWRRQETTSATNPKWRYDLQYKREFKSHEDHTLLFSALGHFFGKEQSSDFENITISGANSELDQQTETTFQQADYIFKLDYTNPLTDRTTLEAGGQYEINDVGNDYAVFNFENDDWVPVAELTNDFNWDQKVLGFYGTGAFEGDKWGLKIGLRVENTDLHTLLSNTGEENQQNYTDFFPSAHASYKITEAFSTQVGYSRRIFRPRLWDLNPFFNIRNNYNIRRGNPDLQPEFSDSYEITGIFIFENISLNTSLYHLYTTQLVERISFFEDNVNITTPVNIGSKKSTGVEVNTKIIPAKWFTLTSDFNYGFFTRQGEFSDQNFDFNGDQWNGRVTTKFKLSKGLDIELTGHYESAYQTVQGEISGFAHADAGIRKKLWDGKAVINIAVRDIFASRKHENTIREPEYNLYDLRNRGRFFTLGISYGFGKGEAMTYSGRRR